jgi:hypothetical protein
MPFSNIIAAYRYKRASMVKKRNSCSFSFSIRSHEMELARLQVIGIIDVIILIRICCCIYKSVVNLQLLIRETIYIINVTKTSRNIRKSFTCKTLTIILFNRNYCQALCEKSRYRPAYQMQKYKKLL